MIPSTTRNLYGQSVAPRKRWRPIFSNNHAMWKTWYAVADEDRGDGVRRESIRAPAYVCIKRSKSGNKTNSVSISNTRIVIHNARTAYTYNSVIKLLEWHSLHNSYGWMNEWNANISRKHKLRLQVAGRLRIRVQCVVCLCCAHGIRESLHCNFQTPVKLSDVVLEKL